MGGYPSNSATFAFAFALAFALAFLSVIPEGNLLLLLHLRLRLQSPLATPTKLSSRPEPRGLSRGAVERSPHWFLLLPLPLLF
jgi:hypothetical protein